MVRLYLAADTGASGFGIASKGLIRELVASEEVELNLKTHNWNWNRNGENYGRKFTDTRFREFMLSNGYVNEEYLVEDGRDAARKQKVELVDNLDSSEEVDDEQLMVKQFDGKEDVWLAIGRPDFAEQAPRDDEIYTILSTDYNPDKIPRRWEHHWDQVDEVWVPAEWVKKSVANRFSHRRPDLVSKTKVFRYGVPMEYEPAKYDCRACPDLHRDPGNSMTCLKDGKFNFLAVSRMKHLKGMYRTVKAFIREFSGDEDVRLFLKVPTNQDFPYHPAESVKAVMEEVNPDNPPAIGMMVEMIKEQYLYDLMGFADGFIQASRAECFGISPLQAAYCGTPVIATDWSAQRELMPDDNPGFLKVKDYRLESSERESEYFRYNEYPPDSRWAVPDVGALRRKMRQLYEMEEEERERRGLEASKYIRENFDWEEKAEERIERLKEVAG